MFNFEGKDFRAVNINNAPWFVAVDAPDALGKKRDSYNMVDILNPDEWMVLHKNKAEVSSLVLFNGNAGRLTLVSESGLYKLIMRAHPHANPAAARFQNWVTREVLPALRKDGMYVMGEEKVKTGEMSLEEMTLRVVEGLKAKNERLALECENQRKIIDDNLVSLTIDAWSALNSHYLTPQERSQMAWVLRKRREASGVALPKETRMVTLANHKVKETSVYIYPKTWLDEAAKSLGIPVNMKFDLIEKGA